MKKIFTFFLLTLFALNSQAAISTALVNDSNSQNAIEAPGSDMSYMNAEEALATAPKKFNKKKGEKLTFGQKIKLKVAQKLMKRQAKKGGEDISKGLYIVLAIFSLGWLAMGVLDDWDGSDWIVCLLLYFLFWLPGFIYALVKMNKYY